MALLIHDQLVHFLRDLYSVELQALAQLKPAPDSAGDPVIGADFRQHYIETEQQADRIRQRLEAAGGSPSALRDAIMELGGKAFLLFAKLQPETPGRLVAHAYAYEAMEWAGYAILIRVAEKAEDGDTVGLARNIQAEERAMMERLAGHFDRAEAASHQDTPPEALPEQVRKHLQEAHALESQGAKLLEKAEDLAGDSALADIYRLQHAQTQDHLAALEARLTALGDDTSTLKDSAMKLGALNWGMFFKAQQDTPAKLLAFAYAVQHLQIAGYELLQRVARRTADGETQALAARLGEQTAKMAKKLSTQVDVAVDATLRQAED